MQCIVVNIGNRDEWIDQAFHHPGGRAIGLHMPHKAKPALIHPTREDAEKEAARLACESAHGGDFAVFELVATVHGMVLSDRDRIKGIGPCNAMVPRWRTEQVEV